MPTQALIRNLSLAQVEKLIADSKAPLTASQQGPGELLVCCEDRELLPEEAVAQSKALQSICDADSVETRKKFPAAPERVTDRSSGSVKTRG